MGNEILEVKNNKIFPSNSSIFDKRIWIVEDVAKVLGLAIGTIYNLTSRREIPFKKRGKRLYFVPDEILNWIEEGY